MDCVFDITDDRFAIVFGARRGVRARLRTADGGGSLPRSQQRRLLLAQAATLVCPPTSPVCPGHRSNAALPLSSLGAADATLSSKH